MPSKLEVMILIIFTGILTILAFTSISLLLLVFSLGELMSIWGLNGSSDSVGDADPCKLLPQLGYRFSAR